MKIYLDFETRSRADLTKVGSWAYAAHPSTEIICIGFAIDDSSVSVMPFTDFSAISEIEKSMFSKADKIIAHNVQFEYAIYNFILHERNGWPEIKSPEKWDCTMARALACGLPASLEGLSLALKLPYQKDMVGRSTLLKVSRPQSKTNNFNEDPELLKAVYKYNAVDVETERAAEKVIPYLSSKERKVFEADLKINSKGILIDLEAAKKASATATFITEKLNGRLSDITAGEVKKASQVLALKKWMLKNGVEAPIKKVKDSKTGSLVAKETMDSEALKNLLKEPDLPENVREAATIRQQVGKSSVAKLKTMLSCTNSDARFRGPFQYHGAHTGRWSGRVLQLQNFPQGLTGQPQKEAINKLSSGPEVFNDFYGTRSMQTLSDILRGLLIPSKGKFFMGADLNAIECRVLSWLAGETWVLHLFAEGQSPYIKMAEEIYSKTGISKKENPTEYGIGKRAELGCGFGMGWKRFKESTYTETSKLGEGLELSDSLAKRAVNTYRALHPRVVSFWREVETAAKKAVKEPGKTFFCAQERISWRVDGSFLLCVLPSKRLLRYFKPSLANTVDKNGFPRTELRYWTSSGPGAIHIDCEGHLGEYRTWGGELVENIVQATARDILVEAFLEFQDSIVLHAHDEILIEDENKERLKALLASMEKSPLWAQGLPIKAEGWIGDRYQK